MRLRTSRPLSFYTVLLALSLSSWLGLVNVPCVAAADRSATRSANLIPNGDFEVGYGHGLGSSQQQRDYTLFDTWDTTQPHHGKACMKIPAWGRLVTRAIPVKPGKTYTVSLWVKPATDTKFVLSLYNKPKSLRAPAATGDQKPTRLRKEFVLKAGWQRVKLSGKLTEYPTADYHVQLGTTNAEVRVDQLQLAEGDPAEFATRAPLEIGVVCKKPSNIFLDTEKVTMRLLAHNGTAKARSGTIRWEVYDYLNRKVKTGSVEASAAAGATWQGSLDLNTSRKGIFRVVLWLDGQAGSEEEVVYSVVAKPKVAGADPTSMIGVHANDSTRVYEALQKLGVKWTRSLSPTRWFRWYVAEPEKGKFVWADKQVGKATRHGFEILGCIHGWVKWALKEIPLDAAEKVTPPAVVLTFGKRTNRKTYLLDLDAWENYVFALADHYKGRIRYWEVCNEPIWQVKEPAAYSEVLRRASRAIRKADPKAKIVGMGGSYMWTWQLKAIEGLGNEPKKYVDFLSTHLYPPGADPFNPSHDTRGFDYHDKIIVPYDIEVWNTETGPWCYGIYQGPNSSYRSANVPTALRKKEADYYRGFNYEAERTVYNFMHTIGNGMTRYFYYDARLFLGPDYYKTHCTIFHYDDTVRTKGIAYAVLAWLFDHSKGLGNLTSVPRTKKGIQQEGGGSGTQPAEAAKDLASSAKVYAYLFDRGGVPLVALWSADTRNRTLALGLREGQVKAYDLMGNERKLTRATVPFGRTPVYLEGQDGLTVAQMKAAVQKGRLTEVVDTTPPNLSISEAPRGAIGQTTIRARWIAADDTSVPSHKNRRAQTAITYSYRLVGRDKNWSDWTPLTVVFLRDLPPGDFRLEVKARDHAGNVCKPVTREFSVTRASPAASCESRSNAKVG